jgi:TATA-binding protein-associated factor Taf7
MDWHSLPMDIQYSILKELAFMDDHPLQHGTNLNTTHKLQDNTRDSEDEEDSNAVAGSEGGSEFASEEEEEEEEENEEDDDKRDQRMDQDYGGCEYCARNEQYLLVCSEFHHPTLTD